MMLDAVLEPVVLALEADQHTSRLTVARDENLLGLRQAQKAREVVLDLSECDLADRASPARRASARLRLS